MTQAKTLTLCIELPRWLLGTTIKADLVTINVNLDDTLPQLKETLSLVPKTENLNNYNLKFESMQLFDLFDELATFEEIFRALNIKQEQTLKLQVTPKPYTLLNVYEHLVKFRQVIGLHFLDKQNQYFGVGGGSSKFASLGLSDVKPSEKIVEKDDKNSSKKDDGNNTEKDNKTNPEKEFTSAEINDISSIVDNLVNLKVDIHEYGLLDNPYKNYQLPIKNLAVSLWNPVPHPRRLKGDLLYLTLQTLENETWHITCSCKGFFVNKSSTIGFNPEVNPKFPTEMVLFNLIRTISPKFETTLIKNTASFPSMYSNPETYLLPSGVVSYPWIVDDSSNPRNHLPLNIENGVDGGDFVKDWNEEFQAIKDLDKANINQRILREKLIMKTINEFTHSATKTAIEIVNGNIPSMNINSNRRHLTYLRNGIFYSFAVDASGNFATSGRDEAARYIASKDLNAVRILNRIDPSDVYCLLTCIVDYLGQRVICQAPIPGIFQDVKDDTTDKVVYGLNSDSTGIMYDEAFDKVLKPLAEVFHLKPHDVEVENMKSTKPLAMSKDVKGLYGTDGRKYIIDLYRTTPLDINFESYRHDKYPHKVTLVRHEALQQWWKRRIAVLFKAETDKLDQQVQATEQLDSDDVTEKPNIVVQGNEIAVNPDVFTGINELEGDKKDVQELSEFLIILIDEFLIETAQNLSPFDGSHLAVLLHRAGINLRYLGYIAKQCLIKKEKEATRQKQKDAENELFQPRSANYQTIYKIAINEMVSRGIKHVLRKLSEDLPVPLMSYLVSHVFNCILGSDVCSSPRCEIDQGLQALYTSENLQFTALTSNDVKVMVESEVLNRFNFCLDEHWISKLDHPQVLRNVSLKFGIQWKAQTYFFTKETFVSNQSAALETRKPKSKSSSKKPLTNPQIRENVFVADDIVSFLPVVKDSTYKSTILEEILETAQKELTSNNQEALILFNELLTFHEQIYGRIHKETASYFGYLCQLYSEMDLKFEAANYARIACILSERTFGIDSYQTITSYINSGYFETLNNDWSNSLKLYTHAIKIWSQVYGSCHPSVINTFANLAESLSGVKLFLAAIKLFEKALELCLQVNEDALEITGLIYYRYGSVLISANNFKAALAKFTKAFNIFVDVLGPENEFTKKSSNFKTNLATYLEHQKQANKPSTVKANLKRTKTKSKKNKIQINEDIATRSVDDILAFIEGK